LGINPDVLHAFPHEPKKYLIWLEVTFKLFLRLYSFSVGVLPGIIFRFCHKIAKELCTSSSPLLIVTSATAILLS
jgi:hypothetical protein